MSIEPLHTRPPIMDSDTPPISQEEDIRDCLPLEEFEELGDETIQSVLPPILGSNYEQCIEQFCEQFPKQDVARLLAGSHIRPLSNLQELFTYLLGMVKSSSEIEFKDMEHINRMFQILKLPNEKEKYQQLPPDIISGIAGSDRVNHLSTFALALTQINLLMWHMPQSCAQLVNTMHRQSSPLLIQDEQIIAQKDPLYRLDIEHFLIQQAQIAEYRQQHFFQSHQILANSFLKYLDMGYVIPHTGYARTKKGLPSTAKRGTCREMAWKKKPILNIESSPWSQSDSFYVAQNGNIVAFMVDNSSSNPLIVGRPCPSTCDDISELFPCTFYAKGSATHIMPLPKAISATEAGGLPFPSGTGIFLRRISIDELYSSWITPSTSSTQSERPPSVHPIAYPSTNFFPLICSQLDTNAYFEQMAAYNMEEYSEQVIQRMSNNLSSTEETKDIQDIMSNLFFLFSNRIIDADQFNELTSEYLTSNDVVTICENISNFDTHFYPFSTGSAEEKPTCWMLQRVDNFHLVQNNVAIIGRTSKNKVLILTQQPYLSTMDRISMIFAHYIEPLDHKLATPEPWEQCFFMPNDFLIKHIKKIFSSRKTKLSPTQQSILSDLQTRFLQPDVEIENELQFEILYQTLTKIEREFFIEEEPLSAPPMQHEEEPLSAPEPELPKQTIDSATHKQQGQREEKLECKEIIKNLRWNNIDVTVRCKGSHVTFSTPHYPSITIPHRSSKKDKLALLYNGMLQAWLCSIINQLQETSCTQEQEAKGSHKKSHKSTSHTKKKKR